MSEIFKRVGFLSEFLVLPAATCNCSMNDQPGNFYGSSISALLQSGGEGWATKNRYNQVYYKGKFAEIAHFTLTGNPLKFLTTCWTDAVEGKNMSVRKIRMYLIFQLTVATFAKGGNHMSTNAQNGGNKFIQTANGFRALSWLRQLSSDLASHPHCPVINSSQTLRPNTTPSPVFPSLHASLSSCLRESPSGAFSASALFGLAQGTVQLQLPEDKVAVATVHLGKLVSPLVLWAEGQVTKVFRCQEEKEDVWVWDRRALETLRYFDSERKLNMVNFDGKWYAWGERRGEETQQQVQKEIFKRESFLHKVQLLVEGLKLETGFLRPIFTLLDGVIGKWKERDGRKPMNDVNFWYEDARAMLPLLEEEPTRRGFHYSSVLPDHGGIATLTLCIIYLAGKWWGLDEETFLREKVKPNLPIDSKVLML